MGFKKIEEFSLTADDGLNLSVALRDVNKPKALVQIIYGMKEWKEKFYDFMEFLASKKIACIVSDNRGHGKSIDDNYTLGYFKSTQQIVEDQLKVTDWIKKLHPDVDLYIYSHSYGTMIAREYLHEHDNLIKGLAMTGTVQYLGAIGFLLGLGQRITKANGEKGKHLSALFDKGPYDWISSNPAQMQALYANPYWTGFKYTNQGLLAIAKSDFALHDYSAFKGKNKDLKVLSLTGELDPFTGGKKGLQDTEDTFKKIGYENYFNIVISDMKHELLTETHKEIPWSIISDFFLLK